MCPSGGSTRSTTRRRRSPRGDGARRASPRTPRPRGRRSRGPADRRSSGSGCRCSAAGRGRPPSPSSAPAPSRGTRRRPSPSRAPCGATRIAPGPRPSRARSEKADTAVCERRRREPVQEVDHRVALPGRCVVRAAARPGAHRVPEARRWNDDVLRAQIATAARKCARRPDGYDDGECTGNEPHRTRGR